MTIAICASFSFYEHVAQLEDELLKLGHQPLIPESAKAMKAANNFAVDPFIQPAGGMDNSQKTKAMCEHFAEIERADAILVVNDEKHSQPNYIGPNVLMEMAVAFALHKPIYLLNDIPAKSPFLDEIHGLEPTALRGDLSLLQSLV
jgi:nucleoside 2-deoxyribosyltransferase